MNSRDEALCGTRGTTRYDGAAPADFARLHCIFYDSNLCHVACLLKVGVMQVVLAMLEGGCVNPTLILDDPLEAVGRFGHDPRLQAPRSDGLRQEVDGRRASAFLPRGGRKVLRRRRLRSGRSPRRRHPGTLRRHAAEASRGRPGRACAAAGLGAQAADSPAGNGTTASAWLGLPEIKLLDHLYSSLDPDEGLYWLYEKAGVTESVASAAQVERFVYEPPDDTRAYARARLLRLANPDQINSVNWDSIGFRLAGGSGWPVYRMLEMADPLAFTKADTAALFDSAEPLETILDALTHTDSAGHADGDTSRLSDRAYPQEQLLLPAPTPRPTSVGSAVGDSDLIIPLRERFHEPEGGQDNAAT